MDKDERADRRRQDLSKLPRGMGNFLGAVPHLPDVSDDKKIINVPWSTTAPEWRRAAPGLNIEGKCQNSGGCRAFNQNNAICPWGFKQFDYFIHERDVKCPSCKMYMVTTNFGVCDGWYRVEGYKRVKMNEPFITVKTAWKHAPQTHYTTFMEELGDLVYWGRLVIEVSSKKPM